jgi:hypothetical protein
MDRRVAVRLAMTNCYAPGLRLAHRNEELRQTFARAATPE